MCQARLLQWAYSKSERYSSEVKPKPFHLARQIGAQSFGRALDPGGDHGFDAHAVLAIGLGHGFSGAPQLRFGGIVAHWPRRLRQHQVQKVFGCIIPVHGLILIGSHVSPKLALVLILLCTALIRVRLLPTPLERDEGEYAYVGQLMLEGIPPYSLASNMKLPGTYAMHALIMAVFGQTIVGIHLGLLLVNSASILMVFLLGRRISGDAAAIGASAVYAALSLSPSVAGTASHATHFVTLFALAGTLLLLDRRGRVGGNLLRTARS